jgi:hypothetical protein
MDRLLAESPEQPDGGRLSAATKFVAAHRPENLGWGPVKDLPFVPTSLRHSVPY